VQQSEAVTTIKKSMKAIKENNTTHGTDDAATGSVETRFNEWDINKWRFLVNT
jgi:hypothetical protein